jgi:hypothetical protein
MTDHPPSDRASAEAQLRDLRQRLDDYGLHRSAGDRSWDELIDLYDAALEDTAALVGIVVPERPEHTRHRFTRRHREQLEAALATRGIQVR